MKTWIKGTNATILSLAVIGIFIVLTIFLHSLKGVQLDLTSNKKFSLSDSTINTLKTLDKPVHVIAFTDPGAGVVNRQVKDLLDEYHKRNSKFTYEEVDPKKQPTVAEQYKIDQYGTLVFESEGKTKNVYNSDLFANNGDPMTGDQATSYSFNGEEKFTQAIVSLVSGEKHKVYFLTGHGELTSQTAAALHDNLSNENYDVADLNLVREGKIPDDAETIFVLGPQSDLSSNESGLLKTYLTGKGKLFFSLGLAKDMDKWQNWPAILDIYGVKSQNALAIEPKPALAQDPTVIVPNYGFHDVVNKLSDQSAITLMAGAVALSSDPNNTQYSADALLKTTKDAYAKGLSLFTSGKSITRADLTKASGDLTGGFDLAYAVSGKSDKKPEAIIVGSSTMTSNDLLEQYNNRDFVLNSISWLQEQKNQISIRPQVEEMHQAFLTPSQSNVIFALTVVVFPLLFLLTGGVIWWRRRKG